MKGRRRRRPSPYELQQISICRLPLLTGISDCLTPDQWLTPLVSTRSEFAGRALTVPARTDVSGPLVAKDVVVRGIRIDYAYTHIPNANTESPLFAIASVRSAVVMLPLIAGNENAPDVQSEDIGLLFRNETLPYVNVGTTGEDEAWQNRYRILWRGMDMVNTSDWPVAAVSANPAAIALSTPVGHMMSRQVRIKAAVRIPQTHGLFFMTEIVQPQLSDEPTIVLDLFGVVAVRTATRGNRYK